MYSHNNNNQFKLIALIAVFLMGLFSSVQAATLAEQRKQYMDARHAIAKGDTKTFEFLARGLRDYPLYPYLEYEKLRRRISVANELEIQTFLDNYSFIPAAKRLRVAWLDTLMKRKQDKKFLKYYLPGGGAAHDCYYLQARMAANQVPDAEEEARKLWLVGNSQPDQCDPIFAWFEKKGYLTEEMIWRRIDLAMEKGDLGLAKYLARKLPTKQIHWYAAWRDVHQKPRTITSNKELAEDYPTTRKIIAYGAKRLALKQSAAEAAATWDQLKSKYKFTTEQINDVEANIALVAAYRHDAIAPDLMAHLPENIDDVEVQQWRARVAMRAGDWPTVLRSIVQMDLATKSELEWKYWRARALEEMGVHANAKFLYERLALERDYYGFLAADRLQRPYTMNYRPLQFSDIQISRLLEYPPLMRARELNAVGQTFQAAREWNQMVGELEPRQLQMAAYIAHQWDWHHTAILTVAKGQHYDDLALRFPQPFDDIVFSNAKKFSLPPQFVYGVMRQESAFNSSARSHAGASGLMQLMPATAKDVARRLNKSAPSRAAILQPSVNVELGSKYLRLMLDQYQNQQVLATAAYNAGPHRVKRWLPKGETMSADVWVDTIPYDETRKYVRRVMDYSTVYQWKISQQTTRLQNLMPPVPAK